VDFTADNPGLTLFHCHQQLHMDFGFMALFDYVRAMLTGEGSRAYPSVIASNETTGQVGPRSSWTTIFFSFLRLGCTSFGGPIAHLGYFRNEFVIRRKWLDEATYADIVALCQFLPGPASSQVGFTIGLLRGGLPGALAAWTAFTLPSALLMFAFAYGHSLFAGRIGSGVLHGLELVAVAVIAHAVMGMMQTLAPDRTRASIAVFSAGIVLLSSHSVGQLIALAACAVLGLFLCRDGSAPTRQRLNVSMPRAAAVASLVLVVLLLFGPPLLLAFRPNQALALFQAFYRTGALVFGGGHVVLPLLQSATVGAGWVDNDVFLAGYGAAQAMPGPLFTFAAYLGAVVRPEPHGATGGIIALLAIFLPGLLLIVGILPFWNRLLASTKTRALFAGVNASVVGLLLAALYQPVWVSTVRRPLDFAVVLTAFLALAVWKIPPWAVVCAMAAMGGLSSFVG
jgi:chromate transporter